MLKGKETSMPAPTHMSREQMGQHTPMFPSAPPRPPIRASQSRVSATASDDDHSPSPSTAHYLSDLRTPRFARPSGSRPPPPSKLSSSLRRTDTEPVQPVAANDGRPGLHTSSSMPIMPAQRSTHRRTESSLSKTASRSPFAGRVLAQPPSAPPAAAKCSPPPVLNRTPSQPYMENGMRWMEKQEVKSLRRALEDMDLEGERKIHAAAQDEAAELVWKHQNPGHPGANPQAPYPNPDLRRDYRSHLRKGSYHRSLSQDTTSSGHRSASDGSQCSNPDAAATHVVGIKTPRKVSPPTGTVFMHKRRSPSGKSYDELASAVANDVASAHRRTSSGSHRILSGSKRLSMRPGDRIWEDPQEEATPPPRKAQVPVPESVPSAPVLPSYVRRNPFARVRMEHPKAERSHSAPILPTAPALPRAPTEDRPVKLDRVEIQRNPPSQSRNPWYMSNEPLPPTPPSASSREADEVRPKSNPGPADAEIRSDDIRAATSKQRKDFSPNLPRPTMVSDRPGRPIVSFEKDARPKEILLEEVHTSPSREARRKSSEKGPTLPPATPIWDMPTPSIQVNDGSEPLGQASRSSHIPTIPTIILPEEPDFASSNVRSEPATPMINIEAPSICVSDHNNTQPPANKPSHGSGLSSRPLPRHAFTAPAPTTKSTPHYTPSIRQSGAQCAHCALPIAGRTLSAGGERFHPGCFVCYQCETNLELVAFYPEPEKQRDERFERIHARQSGMDLGLADDMTPEEMLQQEMADGDAARRFYCHLDFHELFSPRCKSCKTPIEGEVIVACGAEWHAGHFFCAQCGDPFDSTTPFVEKDGYAWCVGCHTNRYSSKCRKCRKPVTDVVVKALGADWHSACFVCVECNGAFDDGRYFLRGDSQDPACVGCEERRLKA